MKAAIAVIVFGFCVVSSHAQIVKGFGAKVGAVSANQTWDYTSLPELPTEQRWGFTAGGFVEFLDIPFISIVVELQYTQKGMMFTAPLTTPANPEGTGRFITLKPRVDYLSIPVLAKVQFPMAAITPYILAGPRVDRLISYREESFRAVYEQFAKTDFGATLGAGIESGSMFPVVLLAEFRYNPSFHDSFQNNFLTVRNSSFDFLLGMRLE